MRKYGFSFSWKRAVGLSALKGRIARQTGIPLTRGGRQRKVGQLLGCCIPFAAVFCGVSATIAFVIEYVR
jgi:hypothetical protein